jgi:hypothetical protein
MSLHNMGAVAAGTTGETLRQKRWAIVARATVARLFRGIASRRSLVSSADPGPIPTPNGASSAVFSLSPRVRASKPCSAVSPHGHASARRTSAGLAWCVRWILLAWHPGGMLAGFTAPGAVNPSRVCPEGECLQDPPLQERSACQASKRRSCVKPSRQGGGGGRRCGGGPVHRRPRRSGTWVSRVGARRGIGPALTPPAAPAPARPAVDMGSAAPAPARPAVDMGSAAPAPARPAVDMGSAAPAPAHPAADMVRGTRARAAGSRHESAAPALRAAGGRHGSAAPAPARPAVHMGSAGPAPAPPAPARVALTIRASAPPPGPPPRRQTLAEPRRK